MNSNNLEIRQFSKIDLSDPFFDSLKTDYTEFAEWFERKSDEGKSAYVFYSQGKLVGFLYPKREEEAVTDVLPQLPSKKRFKIGTFKIEAHGTKLGERFLKKMLDLAIFRKVEELYVTIFPKHKALVSLFETYGFKKVGEKSSSNGIEDVLLRSLAEHDEDLLKRYPYFKVEGVNKWLLAIQPEYHTPLFPDSILSTETFDQVKDVSHTNSIHKVYVCYSDNASQLRVGDLLVIYRMNDGQGPARFRSVATSLCTVEEVKRRQDFESKEVYVEYCKKYSVFEQQELEDWWGKFPRKAFFVIRMCYNSAFLTRLTRHLLIEEIGLDGKERWGVFRLTDSQFLEICAKGGVDGLRING